MDARRSRRLRAGVCFALPALALALCAVLGLSATTAATHSASGKSGHSSLAPAPHRLPAAINRMQDPVGLDLVVAEHTSLTSYAADTGAMSTPHRPAWLAQPAEQNRGPPGGKQV